jgi:hypothetical protein
VSPDPNLRHAAALALTVVAEGCAEPLRKRLPEALALLLGALRDGDEKVRAAAAFAIGQMAEYVQPEVLEHHAQVRRWPCSFACAVRWRLRWHVPGCRQRWDARPSTAGGEWQTPRTPSPTEPPKVLPALLELLSGGSVGQDLLERLIYALDAYVENMEPETILPYMGPLMGLLGSVLSGPTTGAHKEALSCLASVVAAAGRGFAPYAGETRGPRPPARVA